MAFLLHHILPLLFAPSPEATDYQQAVDALEYSAENFVGQDRETAINSLERLLDLVARYPEEASDDDLNTILRAWTIVVGLHLAQGDEAAAREAMDEAIRDAQGRLLPVSIYGPELAQLYKERMSALKSAGMGTIEVVCMVDCKVVIDGRLQTESRKRLFLGSYGVWVKATQDGAPWAYYEVELTTPDEERTIVYEDPGPRAPCPPPPPCPPPKRVLPRAIEIVGLVAGAGLIAGGATWLAIGKDTTATIAGGASLAAVGSGALVVSGVLLGVDEVRVGRGSARQVMVGTTFKF